MKQKGNSDYGNTPATKLLEPVQTIQYGSHHSTEVSQTYEVTLLFQNRNRIVDLIRITLIISGYPMSK
jgi:hypothetical protein